MSPIIVITSRWNSTRIPGKALVDIEGKPLLQRCVESCEKSGYPVIIATTMGSEPITTFCKEMGYAFIAVEDEDDILGRLSSVLICHPEAKGADGIIRVWGDSPLIQARDIVAVYKFGMGQSGEIDYYCHRRDTGEIVTFAKSEIYLELDKTLKNPKDREWIHKYMVDNLVVSTAGSWSTQATQVVDTEEDLERVRGIVRKSQS